MADLKPRAERYGAAFLQHPPPTWWQNRPTQDIRQHYRQHSKEHRRGEAPYPRAVVALRRGAICGIMCVLIPA
jgi:hypothetical protein